MDRHSLPPSPGGYPHLLDPDIFGIHQNVACFGPVGVRFQGDHAHASLQFVRARGRSEYSEFLSFNKWTPVHPVQFLDEERLLEGRTHGHVDYNLTNVHSVFRDSS